MTLRALHRSSAFVIAAFVSLHIANHLASLAGIPLHLSFMEDARKIYRYPLVEVALLFCVAIQVASGLWFVVRGWNRRRERVGRLQAASGAVLALFLSVHVGAVLYGRHVLNLDTNFYFAAAGFHVSPYEYFFGPYYFLAVLALFTHIGCAIYRGLEAASVLVRALAIALPILIGGVVSALIVLSLAGKLRPVEVPIQYKATFKHQNG